MNNLTHFPQPNPDAPLNTDDVAALSWAIEHVAQELDLPTSVVMGMTWQELDPVIDLIKARAVIELWETTRNVLVLREIERLLRPLPERMTTRQAIAAGLIAEEDVARAANPSQLDIARELAKRSVS